MAGQVGHSPLDIVEKLSLFSEHWSPPTVARLNDCEIKVVDSPIAPTTAPHRTRIAVQDGVSRWRV